MRGKPTLAVLALTATMLAPPAPADPAGALSGLVDAAAERLQIAEPVAAYKWANNGAIEDPVRVEHELATLRVDAANQGTDPEFVAAIFADQINATEAIEYARFAGWKFDPAGVQPAPQDLSASRTVIDALNTKILSHISLNWSLLHSSGCARQLQDARTDTIRRRHFDDLYRRALSTATRSYCSA